MYNIDTYHLESITVPNRGCTDHRVYIDYYFDLAKKKRLLI